MSTSDYSDELDPDPRDDPSPDEPDGEPGFPDDPADQIPAAAPRDQTAMTIRLLVLLLIVAGAVVGTVAITRHDRGGAASKVSVGDCVQATKDKAVRVVDCANSAAEYTVVGRVEGRTEVDASMDACAPFQDKGVDQVYWEGEAGAKGMVLCLARNTQ
jgi:hypothetical protein